MSHFIQKMRKANTKRNNFNLTSAHLQSADFMQNNVIFCDYVVPTDHFKITPVFEGRCAALQNPAFVNTEYHVRGFFVPHSIIWKRFDDFVDGNATLIDGVYRYNGVPIVSDYGLTQFLISRSTASETITDSDLRQTDYSHEYDFVLSNGSSTTSFTGYKLNNEGRFIYKLLRSLGYKIDFTNNPQVGDNFNAFPLLSYFRVYLDYYVPSLYYNTSACNRMLTRIYDSVDDGIDISLPASFDNLISDCFDEVYRTYYPSDYLTSVWSDPQSPLGSGLQNAYSQDGIQTDFRGLINSDGVGTSALANGNNTTYLTEVDEHNGVNNPWVARNLQKIADWLTRTRFSGSDKLINILTRFGVKPDNVQMLRSRMVGHFSQPLLVQDVNATSTTYAQSEEQKDIMLGEYAGKMFTQPQNNRTLDFNCDDYGCIIITSQITPRDIYYYDGISRNVLKTKSLDWYQPEFDSMGTQLVSRRELISGLTMPSGLTQYMSGSTYGYVPRYAEYKHAMSNISGDFMVNHLNLGYESFHHFRSMFKYGVFRAQPAGTAVPNTLVPNTGPQNDINTVSLADQPELLDANRNLLIKAQDANQYNRIFNVQNNTIDHIYTMYWFNINASRPMGSIADSIDMEDGKGDLVDIAKPVVEGFK